MRSRYASVALAVVWLGLGGGRALWAQKVPSPEEFLGFEVGADFHLATYDQAYRYFKALEQASGLIRITEVGKTSMGKPMIYATITSAENMARIDRLREISKRLTEVKGLTDDQARKLAAEGRAVVYIDGGLHASECAPAQHNIQLAYDLITGNDPVTKLIRDQVVLVLVFANPDGMDMLAEWYHPNVGTPYEVSPMPWLYHKYVGHDNNRDSYGLNMVETQHLTKIANGEWYPQILYNQHQTAPFPARIWIHPAAEPTNPNAHPLLIRWQNLLGTAMGAAFDRAGQDGAISRTVFDTWYPGYVTQIADGRNMISLLTETALYRYATPHFYTVDDFPEQFRDFTVSTFYPSPWKGGWWRLRDAVEYCLTASKAVLHTAALYREELQFDKYQMGRDTIARFEKEPPYAWIVPREQWDPPVAALLLDKMKALGVQVSQAAADFTSDGIRYPAGTWVVPMNQPFGLFVKNLFEEQRYPDLAKYPSAWQGLVGPQKFADAYLPPYDMGGWTLPYQTNTRAIAAATPLDVQLTPAETPRIEGKAASRPGFGYLISAKTNNSFRAVNRILKAGGEVLRTREAFSSGGENYPPGSFVVPARSVPAQTMDALAKELSLAIGGTSAAPGKTFRRAAPRIALYQSWQASMDEGWTRWLLEQHEFGFANVHDADVRAGSLRSRFDVLVIPSMSTTSIVEGHKPGTLPPQYVGGITENGVRHVRAFVEEGGTLVLLNNAAAFGIEKLGLPVTDVVKDLQAPSRSEAGESKPVEFACPGSLLRMKFDPRHPVAYGMPEEAPALFSRSPAFSVSSFGKEQPPQTVATYPGEHLLMSGFLKGEKYIVNKASVVDVPMGKGRVILLGFGVQSRAMPHGTFKLLFNSLYYGAPTAERP